MKKTLILLAFLFFLVIIEMVVIFNCTREKKSFDFNDMTNIVEEVYIVEIKNINHYDDGEYLDFTIIKTVKEEDLQNFLNEFCNIEFRSIFGSPRFPKVGDKCIMINYNNDTYEVFYNSYTRLLDENYKIIDRTHLGCSNNEFEYLLLFCKEE